MEQRPIDISKAVEKFGGFGELSRKLGVPMTTCHGWARRNKIPPWRVKEMVALAKAAKVDIFVDVDLLKKKKRKAKPKAS